MAVTLRAARVRDGYTLAFFIVASFNLQTRWLYCVECPQHSTRLEALAYLYVSSNTMSLYAEAYLRTKWHFDPSSHLATIDTGRNLGGCCAPYGGAPI